MATRKLRFALLVDSDELTVFERTAIELPISAGIAECVAVVRNMDPPARSPISFRNLGYLAIRALMMRPRIWRRTAIDDLLAGVPKFDVKAEVDKGAWKKFSHGDIEKLKSLNLDFIVRYGFNLLRGDVLDCARFGVWSFHHGDPEEYRGRPAGIWELVDGAPRMGVILQRLTRKLDGGLVIKKGYFKTVNWSIGKTLQAAYSGSAHFILAACKELLLDPTSYERWAPPSKLGKNGTLPRNLVCLKLVSQLSLRFAWRIATAGFVSKKWRVFSLAWRNAIPSTADLSQANFPTDLTDGFLADPFLVPGRPGTLLCEQFDSKHGRGYLSRLDLATGTLQPLLKERYHLSYPCLFQKDGQTFLIPEASSGNGCKVYSLSPDAASLDHAYTILEGMSVIDPTVFEFGGRWWLMCTDAAHGPLSHLLLFYADDPRGAWTPHPMNPIVTDIRSARPAGRPFIINGNLIRPGQNCESRYGGSIRFSQITELNTDVYREQFLSELLPPDTGPLRHGVHHISIEGDTCVLDGCSDNFSMFAWLGKIRSRQRLEPKQGDHCWEKSISYFPNQSVK